MIYMVRVRISIKGHQKRAEAVLKRTWPSLYALDRSPEFEIRLDHWQLRSVTLDRLHVFAVRRFGLPIAYTSGRQASAKCLQREVSTL